MSVNSNLVRFKPVWGWLIVILTIGLTLLGLKVQVSITKNTQAFYFLLKTPSRRSQLRFRMFAGIPRLHAAVAAVHLLETQYRLVVHLIGDRRLAGGARRGSGVSGRQHHRSGTTPPDRPLGHQWRSGSRFVRPVAGRYRVTVESCAIDESKVFW